MIKSTIRKIIRWAQSDSIMVEREQATANYGLRPVERDHLGSGINLIVYPATGGKVVCVNSYDPARDRKASSLYVITDKDDLGEEIGQIITRECLTR